MSKDFATFDCDAHVTEPPVIWERAREHLTQDELEALKSTCWWEPETKRLQVNGKAGLGVDGLPNSGSAGSLRATTVAGTGVPAFGLRMSTIFHNA